MINRQLNLKAMVQGVLLGKADGVCRICFESTAEDVMWLAESMKFDFAPYCARTVSLADILSTLAQGPVEEGAGLPECLCVSCANSAIETYVFLQFMQHSKHKWNSLYAALESCVGHQLDHRPTLFVFLAGEVRVAWEPTQSARYTGGSQVAKRARSIHLKEIKREIKVTKGREKSAERPQQWQCEECGRTFRSERRLATHRTAHARRHVCLHCHKPFHSVSVLNMHITRMHRLKVFPCPDCPKMFSSQVLVTAHRKEVHTYAACKFCGKTYNKHSLRRHEQNHDQRLPCVKCQRVFKSKENLRSHQRRCVEGRRNKVQCGECGNTYSCKGTLSQHYRYAHGDNPLQCAVCGKKYMDKNKLRWHMAEHSGTKCFQCQLCGAYFKQANTLVYHVRAKHTGEKPYRCHECGESFITSFRRTEHARRRHGAPGPVCLSCGATFATRGALAKHQRRHHPDPEPAAPPPASPAPPPPPLPTATAAESN